MPTILQEINWIDILFIILFVGIVYKGSRVGVGGQILPLVGWFVLVFAAIGYYQYVSEAVFGFSVQTWAKPISFLVISVLIFTIIKFLDRIFSVIHSEEVAVMEKIGGAIVAAIRAFIFFGLIGIFFLLTPIEYLHQAVLEDSRSCMYFVKADAQIYSWMSALMGEGKKKNKEQLLTEFLWSSKIQP